MDVYHLALGAHALGSRRSLRAGALRTVQRLALAAASLVYAWSLHYAHRVYFYPVWEYQGFTFAEPDAISVAIGLAMIVAGALAMPTRIDRASTIVVLLLFSVVYVPIIVITLGLRADAAVRYGPSLLMLCAGFVGMALVSRLRHPRLNAPGGIPGHRFTSATAVAWVVLAVILVVKYGSIMSFATLEEVYEQRAVGAADNVLLGYAQTYFSNVLSPVLIVLGWNGEEAL